MFSIVCLLEFRNGMNFVYYKTSRLNSLLAFVKYSLSRKSDVTIIFQKCCVLKSHLYTERNGASALIGSVLRFKIANPGIDGVDLRGHSIWLLEHAAYVRNGPVNF
jgi:hypothetical protein